MLFIALAGTFTLCLLDLISSIATSGGVGGLRAFFLGLLLRHLEKDLPLAFFFLELLSLAANRPSILGVSGAGPGARLLSES